MTRAHRVAAVAVAAIVGVGLLTWQIHIVTLASIRHGFALVGVGFLGILALSGLRYVARALAWTTLLDGTVPLATAVAATIAGDAVGNLTPFRLLASEPAKAVLLRDHVETARALAALVAENVFYSASVAGVIVVGTAAMLAAFDVGPEVERAGWIALGGMGTALFVALWILGRQPALARATLARLPPGRLRALVARLQQFELEAYRFVSGRPLRVAAVVGCEVAFHGLSFAESWFTLWLLTGSATPLRAFVLDTVNRVINVAFMVVPLRMGVAETGQGLVASAIGLGAATGVTFALIGKARVLVWAAVGLGLLWLRAGRAGARTR